MANVRFTDEASKSEASLRPEVAREVSVADNRLAKERAVKLADEGKAKKPCRAAPAGSGKCSGAGSRAIARSRGRNKKLEAAASELDRGGQLEKSSRKGSSTTTTRTSIRRNN